MRASDLQLRGAALAGALALEGRFPGIVFTSGRRGVTEQASVMASNVVQRRRWIRETYLATPESQALQAWVAAHPLADTHAEIAAGLAGVMAHWSDAQKSRLSKHFSGDAFDVQPLADGPRARAIVAAIRGLPGLSTFLEREGGLKRWHAQFAPPST